MPVRTFFTNVERYLEVRVDRIIAIDTRKEERPFVLLKSGEQVVVEDEYMNSVIEAVHRWEMQNQLSVWHNISRHCMIRVDEIETFGREPGHEYVTLIVATLENFTVDTAYVNDLVGRRERWLSAINAQSLR